MDNASEIESLKQHESFRRLPEAMQDWFLASPTAVSQFNEFFTDRNGAIDEYPGIGLPAYYPVTKPVIAIDEGLLRAFKENPSDERIIDYFGSMAHELGHMHSNTAEPKFTGNSEAEYVQYRSELEAKAIFNAFKITKEVQESPEADLPRLPFGTMGYVHSLGAYDLYQQWSAGKKSEQELVAEIAAEVPTTRYNRSDKPLDYNADGVVTHGEKFMEHYRTLVAPDVKRSQRTETEKAAQNNGQQQGPSAGPVEPGGLSQADQALLEQLRGPVRQLDKEAGKGWDDKSERLAASGLVMAKEMGANAGDDLRLVFNKPTDKHEGGTLLHLGRVGPNASPDLAANRAHMPTEQALAVSPEERYQQAETISQAQAEQQRLAQEALKKGPDDPDKGGPKFTM